MPEMNRSFDMFGGNLAYFGMIFFWEGFTALGRIVMLMELHTCMVIPLPRGHYHGDFKGCIRPHMAGGI